MEVQELAVWLLPNCFCSVIYLNNRTLRDLDVSDCTQYQRNIEQLLGVRLLSNGLNRLKITSGTLSNEEYTIVQDMMCSYLFT